MFNRFYRQAIEGMVTTAILLIALVAAATFVIVLVTKYVLAIAIIVAAGVAARFGIRAVRRRLARGRTFN